MAKKVQDNINPYQMINQEQKETIEEMVKRKKAKDREARIKEKNKQERKEEFDFDTETVINMTNRNRIKQDEARRKKLNREEQKRAKKIKKIKFFLKIFIIIGLISGSITFALVSPIFNISNITVAQNNKVATDTIVSLSTLKNGENIFKFYNKYIENKIKENPYIESVKIKRKLPATVEIEVKERVAKYAVDYMGKYAYINTQGYILEISDNNEKLPIIQGATTKEDEFVPGKRLNTEDLNRLEDVIKIMHSMKESGLDSKVTSIDINNKNEYSIYLEEEKKRVHLGDTTNLNNKMLYVQAITEQVKGTEGDIFVNGDINNGFSPYFRNKV